MQYILDSVVQSLLQNPERTFVYGEMVRSGPLRPYLRGRADKCRARLG